MPCGDWGKALLVRLVGLGGGSMAKCLLNGFDNLEVHAIERRKLVADAAKEYFYLPNTKRLTIHIDDAIHHMKNSGLKSDLIFSDLYNSDGMESKQVDPLFLTGCKKSLRNGGVLVLNICHTSQKLKAEFDDLLEIEFEKQIISFDVGGGNTILLAFKGEIPLVDKEQMFSKARCLENGMNLSLEKYVELLLKQVP